MDIKNEKFGLFILVLQIVIGAGTILLQYSLQEKSDDREYVLMAVNILSQPKDTDEPEELRKWAVDVLNKKSPVPFGNRLYDDLKRGNFIFATSTLELNQDFWGPILMNADSDSNKKSANMLLFKEPLEVTD